MSAPLAAVRTLYPLWAYTHAQLKQALLVAATLKQSDRKRGEFVLCAPPEDRG